MKLIRWVEQHIRVGRKKDKDGSHHRKKTPRGANRDSKECEVAADSILILDPSVVPLYNKDALNQIQNVSELKGPFQHHATIDVEIDGTRNPEKPRGQTAPSLTNGESAANDEARRSEVELYSEIPDTPPPPAPPSIANRIPLQHIRHIGQQQQMAKNANGAFNDEARPLAMSETPRERSRIKTNPWLLSSPKSPCCSSSTSGDSGAWTATSSERSARTSSTRKQKENDSSGAVHDWYYAGSGSSVASLAKRSSISSATPPKPNVLYQNLLPAYEPLLDLRRRPEGGAMFRCPSGTRLTAVGCQNARLCGRPESARTYRKNYFNPQYSLDPADLTSSEDEAYSDGYQTESPVTPRGIPREETSVLSQLSSQAESGFESLLTTPVSNDEDAHHHASIVGSAHAARARRRSQSSGAHRELPQMRAVYDQPPLIDKVNRMQQAREQIMRDMRSEDHVSRQETLQEKLMLHRELLQFKQFLLMRTLENIGSELNLSRACVGSPHLSQRTPRPMLSPMIGRTGIINRTPLSPQLTSRQPCPRVPPHQSPRLSASPSKRVCPFSKNPSFHSPAMSPRAPRALHGLQYPASNSPYLIQPAHHASPSKSSLRSSPLGSPRTPRMGRPNYVKPKGVPRTTTIDFQAFAPSRKLSDGHA